MQRSEHSTILSALGASGYLQKHGEVLAVAGLAFLLQGTDREQAFLDILRSATGTELPDSLSWDPELRQADQARPDLIGRDEAGEWRVVVEAKISALLSETQLRSYVSDLDGLDEGTAAFVILVPEPRRTEAQSALDQLGTGHSAVVTWDELLDRFAEHDTDFSDVAQLRSMCDSLGALDVAPFKSTEPEYLETRLSDLFSVCDRVSQRLTPPGDALLPSQPRGGGWYRYFCSVGEFGCCASLGVSPQGKFESKQLIWLRWHRHTDDLNVVRDLLESRRDEVEQLGGSLVLAAGQVWVGLDPKTDVGGAAVENDLVERCAQICAIAGMQLE